MFAIPRRAVVPLALVAALASGACRNDADNRALEQDSVLARDLARAGVDTAAQPELKDVPPTTTEAPTPRPTTPRRTTTSRTPTRTTPPPAPRPAEPAPAPAGPAPTTSGERAGTIASGTTLSLTSNEKVCTTANKVGDRFTATVATPVTGTNGATIPAGARVTIELTQLHRSENANDKIVMGFRVVSLTVDGRTYYPEAEVASAEITRVRASTTGDDAKKVLGGAVAGAIIGQVLGRDRKGTLIGAAAGAAAGGAAAAATADYDGCVNAGAPIVVRLTGSLTIAAD